MAELTIRTATTDAESVGNVVAAATKSATTASGVWTFKSIAIAVGSVIAAAALVGGIVGGVQSREEAVSSAPSTNDGTSAISSIGEETTAGGRSWTFLNDKTCDALASSQDGKIVYFTYDSGSVSDSALQGELYRSSDYGVTTERISGRLTDRPDGNLVVAINPSATCVVVGVEANVVYISVDSAETFTRTSLGDFTNTHLLAISDDCRTIIVGPRQYAVGVAPLMSTDGGKTFTTRVEDLSSLSSLQLISCDRTCAKIVAVSQYRNSAGEMVKQVSVSTDSGRTFETNTYETYRGYLCTACADEAASKVLVIAAVLRYISSDSGATLNENDASVTWTSCALSAKPRSGRAMQLYAGSRAGIVTSKDLGATWDSFSIDNAPVRAIACDFDCAYVYVATDDGVYASLG
jgi:hypothetical protein